MLKQVKLDYVFAVLESYIDTLIMETHYSKHHATYAKNFNTAVEVAGIADKSAGQILSSLGGVKDEASRKALRSNGSGYCNHSLYSEIMSPEKHDAPEDKLVTTIEKQFGSVEALKERLTALAVGQFSSGWAWFSTNKGGEFRVSANINQDNPLMKNKGFVPILGIDAWEHAYYLKYKSLRPGCVRTFLEVLGWKKVAGKYEAILT